MIYEYTSCPEMCGRQNRKRIRSYDPDTEFLSHSYHPIWNKSRRCFLTINFESEHQRLLFELEFGVANLIVLSEIPEMEKIV